ncbi:ChaN family lipoprotein [Elizabethkingia meningoseptica]
MKKLFFAFVVLGFGLANAQNFDAYRFYSKKGKIIKPEKVLRQLADYDVVLFGELHNNSMVHWLQLRVTEGLYAKKQQQLILGAEMFERDNQPQIDRYLTGNLDPKNLKDSVRLWNNYTTDYKPLLDFAKTKNLKFIAGNIPRKYASQVAKQGLESLNTLTTLEKTYIAGLPVKVTLDTPGYKEMKTMMGEHADDMKIMNFISAQAVKDATMAESIYRNIQPGKTIIHYNGNYHSKEYGGIYWYLKQKNPALKIAVISVFESDNPKLTVPEKDYIPTEYNLIVPADMTKTY